jgi:hypothetical protein
MLHVYFITGCKNLAFTGLSQQPQFDWTQHNETVVYMNASSVSQTIITSTSDAEEMQLEVMSFKITITYP